LEQKEEKKMDEVFGNRDLLIVLAVKLAKDEELKSVLNLALASKTFQFLLDSEVLFVQLSKMHIEEGKKTNDITWKEFYRTNFTWNIGIVQMQQHQLFNNVEMIEKQTIYTRLRPNQKLGELYQLFPKIQTIVPGLSINEYFFSIYVFDPVKNRPDYSISFPNMNVSIRQFLAGKKDTKFCITIEDDLDEEED
jgi:hypothetical protein